MKVEVTTPAHEANNMILLYLVPIAVVLVLISSMLYYARVSLKRARIAKINQQE
jgi:hypothetical protein